MQTVRAGAPLQWCDSAQARAAKQNEPRHAQKVAGEVRALRAAGYAAAEAHGVVRASRPAPVVLGNRLAEASSEQFAWDEVQVARKRRVVLRWPFAGTRPWLVLPLSVAVSASGKRRLIFNARYLTLFLAYLRFSYETLRDLVAALLSGGYISTKDLRAGYHHVFMELDAWSLLGFSLRGELFVFTCLPFGLSQAPYLFTRLLHAVYVLPRSLGWRITAMVDDSVQPAPPQPHLTRAQLHRQARWRVLCVLRLEAALGLLHSWDKCQLWPAELCEFLGLLVDTAAGTLRVPDRKLQRFAALVHTFFSAQADADRSAAWRSALGLLASFAPALRMTRLIGRWLREWSGHGAPDAAWASDLLQFWQAHVPQLHGKPWHGDVQPATVLELATDASDHAYGAHVPGGSFRAALMMSAGEGELSSTLREVRGAHNGLQELLRAGAVQADSRVQVHLDAPELLRDKHMRVWLDSQAAANACANERGNASVFEAVKELHRLALQHMLILSFEWHPCTAASARLADALSKQQDPHDWRQSRMLAAQQLFAKPGWGHPELDCFAIQRARQCTLYFAQVWDGSCAAVDALAQSRQPDGHGRPLCFMFPPLHLATDTLHKVLLEGANAIVVVPAQLTAAQAALVRQLPVAANGNVQLKAPHKVLVTPTDSVPNAVRAGGWKTPLQAFRIIPRVGAQLGGE